MSHRGPKPRQSPAAFSALLRAHRGLMLIILGPGGPPAQRPEAGLVLLLCSSRVLGGSPGSIPGLTHGASWPLEGFIGEVLWGWKAPLTGSPRSSKA